MIHSSRETPKVKFSPMFTMKTTVHYVCTLTTCIPCEKKNKYHITSIVRKTRVSYYITLQEKEKYQSPKSFLIKYIFRPPLFGINCNGNKHTVKQDREGIYNVKREKGTSVATVKIFLNCHAIAIKITLHVWNFQITFCTSILVSELLIFVSLQVSVHCFEASEC